MKSKISHCAVKNSPCNTRQKTESPDRACLLLPTLAKLWKEALNAMLSCFFLSIQYLNLISPCVDDLRSGGNSFAKII